MRSVCCMVGRGAYHGAARLVPVEPRARIGQDERVRRLPPVMTREATHSPTPPSYRGGRVARVLVVAPQPFYEDRGTPIAVRQVVEALSHLGRSIDVLTYPVGRSVEIPRVSVL